VNRDNFLFALVGVLIGFVAAYFVYETVAERQPPRMTTGAAASAAAPGGAPGAAGQGVSQVEAQIQQIQQFLQANPDNAEAWLSLANLSFDHEQWALATQAYERYVTLAEPSPDVLSDMGVSLHRVGRSDEALNLFHRAQEMQPDHWQSYYNEVVVLGLDLGRLDEAAEVMAELEELQPDNTNVQRLGEELERRRNAA
jgi:tetratricopeptide (TPR) repeat protein